MFVFWGGSSPMNESMSLLYKKIRWWIQTQSPRFPMVFGEVVGSESHLDKECNPNIQRNQQTHWSLALHLLTSPCWFSGWWFPSTHLKNMLVKLDHSPQIGMKIKEYAKPPPSFDVISWMNNMMKSSILLSLRFSLQSEKMCTSPMIEKTTLTQIPTKICTLRT